MPGAAGGPQLGPALCEAAELLATVVGQDLEDSDDGTFRIARRVAKDRVISTVDPEARHGHKTSARGFDGYKGHVGVDPDSEIITGTKVTPGNAGDASVADELIDDLLDATAAGGAPPTTADAAPRRPRDARVAAAVAAGRRRPDAARTTGRPAAAPGGRRPGGPLAGPSSSVARAGQRRRGLIGPPVYGDAAYGTGEFLDHLAEHGIDSRCKTQPPTAPGGRFPKDRFAINLDDDTVTCPAGVTVTIRRNGDGDGIASFADACADCPLRSNAPTPKAGAPSASAATNSVSPTPAPNNTTLTGPPTTGPPAPRSNANSAT